jgi:hypothetical protein
MTDSDQAALAGEWANPDAFQFTINVALQNEHDPRRAIQWMVEHIVIGLQSGGLPIRGVGPDGTVYLWFPERGKTPDDWLANTWPQQLTAQRRVPIPPGMTTSQARHILARAAREQSTTDADD